MTHRGFTIEIDNGQMTIRNPSGFPVIKCAGSTEAFGRRLIDSMLDDRQPRRGRR